MAGCPKRGGLPHYWLIEGTTAECKYCGQTQTGLDDGRRHPPPQQSPQQQRSYHKMADYRRRRRKIMAVYEELQRNLAQTAKTLNIPPTSLRMLIREWQKEEPGKVQAGILEFELRPGTVRLMIRGNPAIITAFTEGLQGGEVEIAAENVVQVQDMYKINFETAESN